MTKDEYQKAYRLNHRVENARYQRLYTKRHKAKIKAQRIARKALKDGLLEQTPCFVCGESEARVFIYHDDFEQPLDVKFICAKCKLEMRQKQKAESSMNQNIVGLRMVGLHNDTGHLPLDLLRDFGRKSDLCFFDWESIN